jgi:uncharacterized Zn finger protein (UPF0148 family)
MICPKCKKELPDGSKFCNHCGNPINTEQPKQQPQQPRVQKTIQQIGAETELKRLQSSHWKIKYFFVMGIGIAILIAGIAIYATIPTAEYTVTYGPIIVGLIIFIVGVVLFTNTNDRINELKPLANGHRIINVCPKCKSPKIQMHLVQTNTVTSHGTTRVANNVNPLHPFTHTNIKQGNDYTSAAYGNMMICLNCGCTFTDPDKFYM